MNNCPCQGCRDRMIACHAVCRAYRDWKAEEEKRKASIKAEKDLLYRPLSRQAWKSWLAHLRRGL